MPSRFPVLALVAIIATCFGANRASAHDLRGRVTLLPDSIKVEAWFSDDTPAEGAQVTIAFNKSLLSGKTDERGVCYLRRLEPGHYEAVIDLIGHRETISFEVASTSGNYASFSNWRMNQTLAVAIGIGGPVGVSVIFWLIGLRKKYRSIESGPLSPTLELNRSPFDDPATGIPPSSHKS
jgi:hypothetical protein